MHGVGGIESRTRRFVAGSILPAPSKLGGSMGRWAALARRPLPAYNTNWTDPAAGPADTAATAAAL